ncbi:MAG: RloB domain-containing protein [Lachnospiraceae bacterium]|nr:RloB domain-containing protein [Lachnospiraceae bacterium]
MSLKPVKKSDQNKSWMQPRRDRRRMIQPEYHLIVTEGTETEPPYFNAMGAVINKNYPDKINVKVEGKGDNTLSLYSKAKDLTAKSANGYRHVWVVYDTDDFPASHIDETAHLCEADSNDETTYHAIWSNQCVELWFLLHFSFMQSDLHRSEYRPKLTDILQSLGEGEYHKNRDDMYRILYPYMNEAIANARKLEKINEGKPPSKSAPGTMIHKLVEKLKPYLLSHRELG